MSYIRYTQSEFPPFPAVGVELVSPLDVTSSVRARIDTGASRTVVPVSLLEEVGAIRTGRTVSCRSCDGADRHWPVYELTIPVCDEGWPDGLERKFDDARVPGVKGQTEVLLGRDVFAAWSLHLDGPNSRYSVS
jgi:hypothetical protein